VSQIIITARKSVNVSAVIIGAIVTIDYVTAVSRQSVTLAAVSAADAERDVVISRILQSVSPSVHCAPSVISVIIHSSFICRHSHDDRCGGDILYSGVIRCSSAPDDA